MSNAELWTIGRLLTWTADYLKQQGSESPRLDAEVLLAETLQCQRIDLYTSFDEVPSDERRASFRDLVRRRADGTPVAYLVGHREFYSLSFRVTPDVLIPRPQTEHLVIALLDLVKICPRNERPLEIADVGTGSGIISVCAAKYANHCRVTAIDISKEALDVARQNIEAHDVADRIELIESDLFDNVPAERRYDFIVSNPPYVRADEYENLARDVRNHEPRTALVPGPTGTEVIEQLIPQAAERLRDDGWLLMEISPMIEPSVRDLLIRDGRYQIDTTVKDLAGLPRIVRAKYLVSS